MKAHKFDNSFQTTITLWKLINDAIHEPQNDKEYMALTKLLNKLLDFVGENESHELMGLIDFISHLITSYDKNKKGPLKTSSGIDALKFLMEQHNLKQSNLPEIGSQGVVSEILAGKRQLNLFQIKKLAHKFHVSVDTFI